jgi:hypothetical protein
MKVNERATTEYKKTQEEEFVWGHPVWYPSLPLPSCFTGNDGSDGEMAQKRSTLFAQISTGVALPFVVILELVAL